MEDLLLTVLFFIALRALLRASLVVSQRTPQTSNQTLGAHSNVGALVYTSLSSLLPQFHFGIVVFR